MDIHRAKSALGDIALAAISQQLLAEKDVIRISDVFRRADTNGDGVISSDEFSSLMEILKPGYFTGKHIDEIFVAVDTDHSGAIDVQELLDWLFTESAVDELGTHSETDDDCSSSSSSDDDGNNDPTSGDEPKLTRALSDHKKRLIKRNMKHEEPPTTAEEMYELLSMKDGTVGGVLRLDDLVAIFAECKLSGLGPRLVKQVPQQCVVEADHDPEDVSPLEVCHLYALLEEQPAATPQDALACVLAAKDVCRGRDCTQKDSRRAAIKETGLTIDQAVTYQRFCRLLELISSTMRIDQEHILAIFAWARTCRFEMTERMAIATMERVFLKVGKTTGPNKTHVMDIPVSENDFVRMCYSVNIIDARQKKGLMHGKLPLMFQKILKHFPRLLAERSDKRYLDRGKKKVPRKKKHSHRSIVGRTQLSALFEELFKAIPCCYTQWRSPVNLTMQFLETAGEAGDKRENRIK